MATQRAVPSTTQFNGFPQATFDFYKDVAKHNDGAWFQANRQRYLDDVIAPAQAFVAAATPKLQKLSPGVSSSPDYSGKGSIKKIHTDQRYIKGRAPLKTWLDVMFWEGPLAAKKDNSAFYLRLDMQTLGLAVGVKMFQRPVLQAYRAALADAKLGRELLGITQKVAKQGFEVKGSELKQYPRGFDSSVPWADLTLHDALYAWTSEPLPKEIHSAALVDHCVARWKAMAPLHSWLVHNVLARL